MAAARPRTREVPQTAGKDVDLFLRGFPAELAAELRALAAYRRVRASLVVAEAVGAYLDRAPEWRRRRMSSLQPSPRKEL